MKQLAFQILLILGTVAISWRLLIGYGQKAQAVRRLGLLAFAGFAILSVLFPTVWTSLANLFGIGRGADLILYGLVVAFFSFVVTTFKRFRDMEIRYTRLARRISIDEVPPPWRHPSLTGAAAPDEAASGVSSAIELDSLERTVRDGAAPPKPPAPATIDSELPHDAR